MTPLAPLALVEYEVERPLSGGVPNQIESMKLFTLLPLAVVCALPALAAPDVAPAPAKIDFNRDIRPILSENCFACHGPDAKQVKGGLRLDHRDSVLTPAKSGKTAIVPKQPTKSELVHRIFATDADDLMPPPESNKKLTAAQKDLLKRWIAAGAEYQTHWAYVPPVKAAVPVGQNGVDFLVRARLKEIGLKSSPEADRRTLVRRLYFDLLGLPPKPEEVDAFANDTSPTAHAKLVERLLASPHYGERMAIGWLDVVRFADTIGYHSDTPRNVYPYRDYVIRAFNENKRFDQFTREQLAGDLLAGATLETRVGSAFNRLLLTTEEGGAQAKDYEARYLTDRVRAVGAVWLAQTIGCAQCHDHKFDPTTARDFYSMGAFFADIKEPIVGRREDGMVVPSEKDNTELARLDGEIARRQKELDAPQPQLARAFAQWQETALNALQHEANWKPLAPATAASAGGAKLTIQPDRSVLASGKSPDKDTYTVTLTNGVKEVTGLRIEVLPDDSLPSKGPGRAANGNFVLTEIIATVKRADKTESVKFAGARATFEQTVAAEKNPNKAWTAASTINGDAKGASFGWAVLPEVGRAQQLILELAARLTLATGDTLTIELRQNHGNKSHTLGRFRIGATTDATAARTIAPPAPPADLAGILQTAPEKRTVAQQEKLLVHFKGMAPELAALRQQLAVAKKTRTDFESKLPRCIVSESMPAPRTVRILARGNWMDDSGAVIQPALPAHLSVGAKQPDGRHLNRLDLADWIVARENPLTARVFVNRLWKQFFGTGLSKVLDDLGAQGEPPPNAALLDWLACEFRDSGWDVKHLVRLIVTSQTYRQTSTASREMLVRDPDNREHARQSRWRLDAELVRDNALAVSGLLVAKIGGPSVKPYQPDGYWENLNFPVRSYPASEGEDQHRRGLYTWWQRSFVHPSMLAFDAPTREECAADRARSNIPQQALVLLNDPTYVESARAFAARIVKEGGADPNARLAWAWKQTLSRAPRADEAATVRALFDKHLAQYKTDTKAAEAFLKIGIAPLSPAVDPAELAAWTNVARILLNLHETITRS